MSEQKHITDEKQTTFDTEFELASEEIEVKANVTTV